MVDDPFMVCLRAFVAHDYQRAANLAVNLLQQRRYHWLYQVILISLRRLGNDQAVEAMGKMALEAFVEHSWETQLLRLTLEDLDIDAVSDLDLKAKCQLFFYLASSLLTRGQRAAARPLFEISALTQVECTEAVLAGCETARPESRTLTLSRVLSIWPDSIDDIESAKDDEDTDSNSLRYATVAVEILEDIPGTPEPPDELRELRRLASGLGSRLHQHMSREEARNLYDRLSRAPVAIGQVPAVPRRVPAGPPPLRAVRVVLKQLALDRSTELERAATAFGFPLFLGRHPFAASAEQPIHKLMRDTMKDGREVSPFCRRRFSGDTSAPFPRTRYHALGDPRTGDDGGTIIAEMMAYTMPALTGYCAIRQGQHGLEVIFRGLPDEPNPFYLACSEPDKFQHVWSGHPSGNPLRELPILPSADNVLTLSLATRITEQHFERCLDLRMLDAREWLTRLFANPPDGPHGDALRAIAYAHRFELRTVGQWSAVLPVLIARTIGGNPLTDMVGAYLRSLGCDALVFPSARNDFFAAFSADTLISASGWNLVDYRGLDPVDRVGIDVGDQIEPLTGPIQMLESADGETRGSVRLSGNNLTNRLINQLNYEYFLAEHGRRWRLEHKEFELFARSYLWYRRRLSPGEKSFLGMCDQCENSFKGENVATLLQCPVCGFEGD